MKYDDAAHHVGEAPSEAHAGAPIGLYFRWCVSAGLVSDEHTDDSDLLADIEKVRTGSMTGTEYVWETNSGKLADIDLNDEGNAFTKCFYSKSYPSELRDVTGKGDYEFTEEEVDFARLKDRLDAVLQTWRNSPPKPWWRFW
jgi:hypothetical protein